MVTLKLGQTAKVNIQVHAKLQKAVADNYKLIKNEDFRLNLSV